MIYFFAKCKIRKENIDGLSQTGKYQTISHGSTCCSLTV